jgi:hypothetical protein
MRRSWRFVCMTTGACLCYGATNGSKYSVAWATAWPSPAVSMPPVPRHATRSGPRFVPRFLALLAGYENLTSSSFCITAVMRS